MNYTSAEEENKAYFAQVAPVYDEMRKGCYGNALRDLIIDKYPPAPGTQVADIGTGTGYLARVLAPKVAHVTAIDSSTAMLEVAGMDLAANGIENVSLVEGDAHELPLGDASQDMVYANLLLHHLAEPQVALKEMHRVLKPAGRVVLTDVKRHYHKWVKDEKFDLWMGFEAEEVQDWLDEAGFKGIEVLDLGCNCRTSNKAGMTVEIPMFLATAEKGGEL